MRHADDGTGATPRRRVARRSADLQPTLPASSSAASSSTAAATTSRRSTRPPRRCWPRCARPAPADVDGAVGRRPPAYERRLVADARRRARQVPVPHRPGHRRARPRTRRGGDPGQRQADQGVPGRRRAHWRRRTSSTTRAGPTSCSTPGLGAGPAAARRGRAGHPVELPAADGRLEDRPGARRRQHRRDQTRRDHTAVDRWCWPRSSPRPTCRRAWSTSSPAPGTSARAGQATPASTRWRSPARPRSARQIQRSLAGTGKRLTLELGGKAANIVFDDAADRPGGRGRSSTASSSTRATSAARARGCWCRNRSPTRSMELAASAGSPRCGSATRWTRTPTSARSTRRPSWTGSVDLADAGRRGGRRALDLALPAARPRFLLRRRRSSPRCRSRCGSPGRRSSGRCCRC